MRLMLSVIVPVYNVERYLRKCVESLLCQDLSPEEYELILVDDGSPDGSPIICDEYASKHENIKVVHRENGGLSVARNTGINVAQGKYIQFVDSDDYLEPNVLKSLVQKMENKNLDVLRFNYRNVNGKGEEIHPNKDPRRYVDYSDKVCDGLTFLSERLGPACYACQFMIRRDLLEGCLFKEGIYFEDMEWTPRMLLKAQRVTSTDFMVYNYLMRAGSITRGVDKEKKRKSLNDRLLLIDSIKEHIQNVSDRRWFEGMIAQVAISIVSSVSSYFYPDRKRILKTLLEKNVFPLSTYNANKTAVRKIRIANVSPKLLCWILRKSR